MHGQPPPQPRATPTGPALMTRKRSTYGLSIWRLPERPSRSGHYYQSRPHYALAPRHWTAAQVWVSGLVYVSYDEALIGLGRISAWLAATRHDPVQALHDYVAQQAGYGLRTPEEWREPVAPDGGTS